MGKEEQGRRKVLRAMDLMVKSLVKMRYATKEKAEVVRERLLNVPEERCIKVNLRDRASIERFIREEIPEWSDEWLLE